MSQKLNRNELVLTGCPAYNAKQEKWRPPVMDGLFFVAEGGACA